MSAGGSGTVASEAVRRPASAHAFRSAYNTLTLNLAHEIVTGARSVVEARQFYAETASAYAMGGSAPYAERLLFESTEGGADDPDESIIADRWHARRQRRSKTW